jgi:DNA-binding transcriptional LysR family regulator
MSVFARSDLSDLNVFLTIVRRGGFRQAAIELGVTTSALSHTLRKLEGRLEVRLLNRTSRPVVPTHAGSELARRLAEGFQTIGDALSALDAYRHSPVGRLRINVPKDASRLLVAPVLAGFLGRYPQVHLDLTVEDRPVAIPQQVRRGEPALQAHRYPSRACAQASRIASTSSPYSR